MIEWLDQRNQDRQEKLQGFLDHSKAEQALLHKNSQMEFEMEIHQTREEQRNSLKKIMAKLDVEEEKEEQKVNLLRQRYIDSVRNNFNDPDQAVF
mmetsp:Transcript_21502/g.20663  ORF Transcript_21502/g.20663 Transcript_21502/m.20663 type:complete len:95 (+) Transcript_21502:451-735(+)